MKKFSQFELYEIRLAARSHLKCYDEQEQLTLEQLNVVLEAFMKDNKIVTAIWNELEANAAYNNLLIMQLNGVCYSKEVFRTPEPVNMSKRKELWDARDEAGNERNDAGADMMRITFELTGINLNLFD